MIQHAVIFKLKHAPGSAEETKFLDAAKSLVSIPGVENFECLRQISSKNPFDFGLSMKFADQATYDRYNEHPDHTSFLENYWVHDVVDFLEIDFKLLGS